MLTQLGPGNLSTEETKVCSSLAAGRSCENVLMWGKRVSLQPRIEAGKLEASIWMPQVYSAQGQLECFAWQPAARGSGATLHKPPGSNQQICLKTSVDILPLKYQPSFSTDDLSFQSQVKGTGGQRI